MIEVELPDGSIAEFPDGTDQTVIKGALQKRFGAPAQPAQAPAPQPETSGLRSFAQGLADMASLGFSDEIAAGLGKVGGMLPGGHGKGYDELLTEIRGQQKADADAHPIANISGQVVGGLGSGAALARGGLSLAANAASRGASLGRVATASAADGTILGAASGFGSGEGASDRLSKATTGGALGLAVGGAAPLAVSGARRLVSPMRIAPERQAMVDTLRKEGIELTAGQSTGNKTLAYMESELGGGAGADFMERQAEQFTAAALRRAGIDANRATPDVIDQGIEQLGQKFDELAARNRLMPDKKMVGDIRSAITEYNHVVPETARAPIVNGLTRDIIMSAQQPGGMTGEAYQAVRSRLDKLSRSTAADPHLSGTLRNLRSSLDDAMERSIKTHNPADAGAWKDVRGQYKNLLVIEKAATGAGENAAAGLISPSQLRNAVVSQGRRAYARGKGDLAQLARAGERLLKPLPQSGTAPRTAVRNIGLSIPTLLGAGMGAPAGALGSMAGAAIGAAAPFAAGRALLSDTGRKYLTNQAAAGAMSGENLGMLTTMMNQLAAGTSGRIAP